MKFPATTTALLIALAVANQALSQFRPESSEPASFLLVQKGAQPPTVDKEPKDKKAEVAAEPDPFAAAPRDVIETSRRLNPRMMGDPAAYFARQNITVPAPQTITVFPVDTSQPGFPRPLPPVTFKVPGSEVRTITVPVPGRGGFKIAENESPKPEDRVFFTYNYYDNLRGPADGSDVGFTRTTQTTFAGFPATVVTQVPGIAPPRVDLHRQLFGFEKTFLGGDASFGLRAPLFQQNGDGAFDQDDFGDLSIIGTYAFVNDDATGDVISAGLMITTPTGPAVPTFAGDIRSVLLQPFVGWIATNQDRFFIHGFTSLVVPTDSRDVTLLFNDVGIGYWLYRAEDDRILTAVVPTLEVHVTTPLNNRDDTAPIFFPDTVVLTGGVHLGLWGQASLTLGLATPVTGPRPFDVEAIAQFNLRF
jgi:hypothetical protein